MDGLTEDEQEAYLMYWPEVDSLLVDHPGLSLTHALRMVIAFGF